MTSLVFITGAPRSGTSVLKKILRLHPEVAACGIETGYIFELYDQFGKSIVDLKLALQRLAKHPFGFGSDFTDEFLSKFGNERLDFSDFILKIMELKSVPKLISPTILQYPGPGIIRAKELLELFPGSRFVVLQRDPRANVSSQLYSFDNRRIVRSIRLWKQCYAAANELARDFPEQTHILQFEDLVCDSDSKLGQICRFMGVQERDVFQEFEVSVPDFTKGKPPEVKKWKSLNPATLDKWKTALCPNQISLVEMLCRVEMKDRGDQFVGTKSLISLIPFAGREFCVQGVDKLRYILRGFAKHFHK